MKTRIFNILLVVCLAIPFGTYASQIVPPTMTANELEILISSIQSDFDRYGAEENVNRVSTIDTFKKGKTIKIFDAMDQLVFELELTNPHQWQHPKLQQLLGASHFLTSYGGTWYYHLEVNRK